jgi:hypothetical protein
MPFLKIACISDLEARIQTGPDTDPCEPIMSAFPGESISVFCVFQKN